MPNAKNIPLFCGTKGNFVCNKYSYLEQMRFGMLLHHPYAKG